MPTYRTWPSTSGGALVSDSTQYTMGMQFTLSQNCTLHAIWWWSPTGAGVLPKASAIYQVTGAGTGSIVSGTQNNSPSWSGTNGSGWVSVAYGDTTILTSGLSYKVVVQLPGTDSNQYGSTAHYWDTGSGGSGIINGPLNAVNNATADGGQDTFTSDTALTYPSTSFNATNYWVDVEVTPAGGTPLLYSMRSFP